MLCLVEFPSKLTRKDFFLRRKKIEHFQDVDSRRRC